MAKNFYLYCDTNDGANAIYGYANSNGTNEWAMVPWDKDLTFGKSYGFTDYQIARSARRIRSSAIRSIRKSTAPSTG